MRVYCKEPNGLEKTEQWCNHVESFLGQCESAEQGLVVAIDKSISFCCRYKTKATEVKKDCVPRTS